METYNPADHMVMCRKYKQNLPKMPKPPFPNKLGEELQNTVSAKAWNEWLEHQTMLINENHLSMIDQKPKNLLPNSAMNFWIMKTTNAQKAGQRKINNR